VNGSIPFPQEFDMNIATTIVAPDIVLRPRKIAQTIWRVSSFG
jgi:hypothetical protein